jgi:low temperature requirement protein LtrA
MDRGLPLATVLRRVRIWWSLIGLVWLAGAFAEGDLRLILWSLCVALFYAVVWLGFPLPRLGHSHTTDYTIAGAHMAERCLLFITLALGESVLITGSNFGELPSSTEGTVAFVVAFCGSVAFWWIYFDRAQEAARDVISTAEDPGWLGLVAYTYFHIPMVAGIIVAAAADEVTIAHPTDEVTVETAALILGGPALYLAGNALFKLAVWNHIPAPRLAAFAGLALLIPLAFVSPTVVLLAAATLVVVTMVVWDLRSEWSMAGQT